MEKAFLSPFKEEFTDNSISSHVPWNSSVIAVLGLYNKGKTFILNNLSQLSLLSGDTLHTEGLSFKVIRNKHVNHILLDTAGLYHPVVVSKDSPDKNLAVNKATELFLEDLTFLLADLFIVVVNDLTSLDQEYIQKLTAKLVQHPQKFQKFFIVHNFKDTTDHAELKALWKQQVVDNYKSGEAVVETILAEDPVTHQVIEKEVSWLNTKASRHICIGNAFNSSGQYNKWVFTLLKQWLSSVFVPVRRTFSPIESLLKSGNIMLKYYVENCGELWLDVDSKSIRMKLASETRAPKIKPATIDVNGFVFVDAEYVPRVDTIEDTDGLHIYLDVPGLTEKYKIVRYGWNILRITGVRDKPFDDLKVVMEKQERKYGTFKREFEIPAGFDIGKANHSYEDGVLHIHLSKSPHETEL